MKYKSAISAYDTFLDYRTVIIRAVALAWKDEKYYEDLRENPKTALEQAFNYTFPYDMNLKIRSGTSVWRPELVGCWVVESQNQLNLILPPKPTEGEEAVALASYISNNLTFLTPLQNQES